MDCVLTNKQRYKGKALSSSLVQKTWQNVLFNEKDLPNNWYNGKGKVLVGMLAMGDDNEH